MNFGKSKKKSRVEDSEFLQPEFDVYNFCKEKWNLSKNQIVEVSQKETYKNFVEYTVNWESEKGSVIHTFKIIKKGKRK